MTDTLEQIVARHCAPALAGIKASSLVSFCLKKYPDLDRDLKNWNLQMNKKGIYFKKMAKYDCRTLVLVYRKKNLEEHLWSKEILALLDREGYPVAKDMEAVLNHLKLRMRNAKGFPHEIGLFLGYPLEDVEGFMRFEGQNYKLNGYWKVYSDEERANRLFERYTKCRDAVCRRVRNGCSIAQIFTAA